MIQQMDRIYTNAYASAVADRAEITTLVKRGLVKGDLLPGSVDNACIIYSTSTYMISSEPAYRRQELAVSHRMSNSLYTLPTPRLWNPSSLPLSYNSGNAGWRVT